MVVFGNTVQFSGSLMKRMTDFRARKSSQQCTAVHSVNSVPEYQIVMAAATPTLPGPSQIPLPPPHPHPCARAIDARARTARACVSVLRAQCARGVSSSTFYGPRCALPFKQPAMRAHLVRRAGRRPVRRRIPCQRNPACCALQISGKERPDKFAHAISQRDGVPARTRACWNVRVNACAGRYKDRPVLIRVVRNVGGNLHDASHSYHFDVVQIHARCILLRRVSLRMCVLVCSSV